MYWDIKKSAMYHSGIEKSKPASNNDLIKLISSKYRLNQPFTSHFSLS
jgi:hypothetical protein